MEVDGKLRTRTIGRVDGRIELRLRPGVCREIGESHHVGCLLLPRIVGSKTKVVGERYLCATRSPTMPRPLRARHSRDAARARSHHRNRLRAAPQGRRRRSSSSLHVLRFLGAAPCICACNQIEWLLALSALWDGSAAGGGACSALVGLSIGPFAACFTWRARGAACDMLRLLPD